MIIAVKTSTVLIVFQALFLNPSQCTSVFTKPHLHITPIGLLTPYGTGTHQVHCTHGDTARSSYQPSPLAHKVEPGCEPRTMTMTVLLTTVSRSLKNRVLPEKMQLESTQGLSPWLSDMEQVH